MRGSLALHHHLYRRWLKGDYLTGQWYGLVEYLTFLNVEQEWESYLLHVRRFEELTSGEFNRHWHSRRVYPYRTREAYLEQEEQG